MLTAKEIQITFSNRCIDNRLHGALYDRFREENV